MVQTRVLSSTAGRSLWPRHGEISFFHGFSNILKSTKLYICELFSDPGFYVVLCARQQRKCSFICKYLYAHPVSVYHHVLQCGDKSTMSLSKKLVHYRNRNKEICFLTKKNKNTKAGLDRPYYPRTFMPKKQETNGKK